MKEDEEVIKDGATVKVIVKDDGHYEEQWERK